MERREFEFYLVLGEAVHEGLESICPSICPVVTSYMNKKGTIRSDHYIDNPEAFDEGLKEMFGFGAKVIEKIILEVLYRKLQAPKEVKSNFNFVEELRNAEKLFCCAHVKECGSS